LNPLRRLGRSLRTSTYAESVCPYLTEARTGGAPLLDIDRPSGYRFSSKAEGIDQYVALCARMMADPACSWTR
jgi:hypothetical protein